MMRIKHQNPTTDIHFIENGIYHLAQIEDLIEKPSVIMMIQRLEKLINSDDDLSAPKRACIEYENSDDVKRNLELIKFEKRNSKSSGKSGGSFNGRPQR
ncbi:hypothetical protein L2755_20340 [Shewanella abyssi]|uniref:hypothetical protein n=1 Tax=Shewanella abyssi TaxID=311789 RepID=UPI00200FC702|nr:hypothetical protein [Shewanella abyssi]MCL1051951.1 hypothetical protein [Shewanella abyssi]